MRVRDGYQTYVLDYHPFDVVGWDGYVYPWTFNIDDFEPITGRIHMPPPVAPDLPGPELRDLLVLPAQARLRPGGDPDPVPALEREQRGDDLLRLRQLLLAEAVDVGPVTLHPPASRTAAPWARERAIGMTETHELAVMCDTFDP